MKLSKLVWIIVVLNFFCSCGGGGSGGSILIPAALVSITIEPATVSIVQGTTVQFNATGSYSDGSTKNITTSVTWNSSDASVASVNTSGAAAALKAGATQITASSGNIQSNPALLTVVEVTSLEITPSNPSVGWGATQQFAAAVHFSDGTTKDVTREVLWSSSVPFVVAFSNRADFKGIATAFDMGTSTITATWNNVRQSTVMNVTAMDNVMKITVNGSLCSSYDYPNKPCVRMTICSPGTVHCKTVNDILLDTGSTGLRIFKSVISDLSLTPVTNGMGVLANCTQYVDESAHWGSVQRADIVLGNQTLSNVPIHVIDADFGIVPTSCGTPERTPEEAKLNGILGTGLFTEDCGSLCADYATSKYYTCNDTECVGTKVPLQDQVKNPVALLPSDNNGCIIRLPSVDLGGAVSVNGVLVLGIGTRSNNDPSGITASFSTDEAGEFTTIFRNISYNDSFMDTGSNGLFFNKTSLASLIPCGDWYCPAAIQNLSASLEGQVAEFQIGNANNLFQSNHNVFVELGGPSPSFDWGLPFFLGRSVYIGVEGKSSLLGEGPYLAY